MKFPEKFSREMGKKYIVIYENRDCFFSHKNL